MFFRKNNLKKLEDLIRIFFIYEEMDICYRLRKRDLQVCIITKWKNNSYKCKHKNIKSTKKGGFYIIDVLQKNYSYFKFKIIQLFINNL